MPPKAPTLSPPQTEPSGPGNRAPRALPFWANPRLGLLVVIVILFVVFASLRPAFLNVNLTIVPMQSDLSVFVIVGLAQLAALSLGHMNLAVGPMAAFSAFAMGWACDALSAPLIVGLLFGLIVGGLVGAAAGWVIAVTGVNSFVVTLALNFALLGLVSLLYSGFGDGVAFNVHPAGMDTLRNNTFSDYCVGNVCGPPIPLVAPIAIAAALLVAILYRRSRLGREILMTGSNLRAAELSASRRTAGSSRRTCSPACSPRSPASCSPSTTGRSRRTSAASSCCPRSSARFSVAPCWPVARSACSARSSAPH